MIAIECGVFRPPSQKNSGLDAKMASLIAPFWRLLLVRPMKARVAFCLFACLAIPSHATQTVYPPLTSGTLVGVWEAIFPNRDQLLHMEIRSNGDSYLTWVPVGGRGCSCWRLVASEVLNGVVKLRFGRPCGDESPPELWMIGSGTGVSEFGEIDAQFCGTRWPESPPPRLELPNVADAKHILFRKGTWTRDFTTASQTAENKIKEMISSGR
jgi:hypothetical protein